MKSTRMNIETIQKDGSNLESTLNSIKNSENNILFTNCTSLLKVGNKKFQVQFNTALYCDTKELLILGMHGGKMTPDTWEEELARRNITYHEVVFDVKEYRDSDEEKQLWFARDGLSLENAITDSKRKGMDTCTFYPTLKGKLEIKYNSDLEGTVALDRQEIRGVIEFEDKLILIINHTEDCNVYYKKALRLLSKNDIATMMETPDGWNRKNVPKQYKKGR